jgi:hypothetical protein
MNPSIPVIRLGLFALTGAMILGMASLYSPAETATASASAAAARPPAMLAPASLQANLELPAAAHAAAAPTLPTVHVRASEEEILAARIDPTDRIAILSAITITPSPEEVAAAMQPAAFDALADADAENGGGIGAVFGNVATPHRLRLDMPYYSFGKVLTHPSRK